MEAPQIITRCLLLSFSVFLVGCDDSNDRDRIVTHQTSTPDTSANTVEVARRVVDEGIEWRDSITSDGRMAKLFRAPEPKPDETKHYRVSEGDETFAIILARYGQTWIGSVANLSSEDPVRQFTQTGIDECLAAIQAEYQFSGDFERILDCAFP